MKPLLLAALLLASTAGAQVHKWEYATYRVYEAYPMGGDARVSLALGNKTFQGESFSKFLESFFGKDAKKYANLEQGMGFFNYLGSLGWELVTFNEIDNSKYDIRNFYFKRVVAK